MEASGEVYQDSIVIATVHTQHDGMGKFRLPVNPGKKFYAVMKTEEGVEKRFDLPEVSETGWGLSVSRKDSILSYRVIKGENAILPEELYSVVHCRGIVVGRNRLNGVQRGSVNLNI